jgi:hypothetical protein
LDRHIDLNLQPVVEAAVKSSFAIWLALGTTLIFPGLVRAQSYSIDWYKVSGGGGTSTGGVYQLSGTIGQHDAGGPTVGAAFSLVGGFWSLIAVQTPGAPLLSIRTTGTNSAIVSWPVTALAFHLQQTPSIENTNWVNVATPVNLVNGTNEVTISPVLGNQFYRLKYP